MTIAPCTDWRALWPMIPVDYRDNGCSSPVMFLYPILYGGWTCSDIAIAARLHDFCFGAGRLRGGPVDGISMHGANGIYRQVLLDRGHDRIARLHYDVLEKFGWYAWQEDKQTMYDMGWHAYADFMAEIQSCGPDGVGFHSAHKGMTARRLLVAHVLHSLPGGLASSPPRD